MSFKKFGFSKQITTNLERLGYREPTPIQQKAIPPILDGHDLIGLAQTGTGKTAAFTLPLLDHLIAGQNRQGIRALILSPTRELAEQTGKYIEKFSSNSDVRSIIVYGGVNRKAQVDRLKRGCDIVVGCPGRLLDLSNTKEIDLSNVEVLVLDEADQMLDQGFLPDVKRILKKLPGKRQNLIFSATMPAEIKSLTEVMLKEPVSIDIKHTKPAATIAHSMVKVESQEKSRLLKILLGRDDLRTAIVFTKTKYKAKNLARSLSNSGFQAISLQGNMSQNQRQHALDGFKRGDYRILVATDIAARGIDVAGISHVINFDMPGTLEAYTHRVGRTGRMNQTGQAITIATEADGKMVKNLERILAGELVIYRESFESPITGGQEEHENNKIHSKRIAPRKSMRKTRGKRSSQRNRARSFDFGI